MKSNQRQGPPSFRATATGVRRQGAGGKTRKGPCPDCLYCQGCSKDRCRLCRIRKEPAKPKLTFEEQIALYERINRKEKVRKK